MFSGCSIQIENYPHCIKHYKVFFSIQIVADKKIEQLRKENHLQWCVEDN